MEKSDSGKWKHNNRKTFLWINNTLSLFYLFLLWQGKNRLICYALILLLWSLSFTYTNVWTTTLIAYDERKIEIFSRTSLFNKETTIPFQAIKSVKKDYFTGPNNSTKQVKIEYVTDDGETQEVTVYSGWFFNYFGKNQQRRYEIFSGALITD
ncbi:MAG: hypothetical protein CML56_01100 [Rhodobacteraceae bacterium]|nr:hypothetical protein [Paracoccaceae bacterium]